MIDEKGVKNNTTLEGLLDVHWIKSVRPKLTSVRSRDAMDCEIDGPIIIITERYRFKL